MPERIQLDGEALKQRSRNAARQRKIDEYTKHEQDALAEALAVQNNTRARMAQTPSRAEAITGVLPPLDPLEPEDAGSHLDDGQYPVWFEKGRPEPKFGLDSTQPAVNPYTGQPLKETSIFGGLGRVSEAFATPSDASIRFQNPYADSNLSPMQQKMAAAEIGAIQDSMMRSKSKTVWDIVKKNGRKVKEIMSDPTIPQSVKQQVYGQYTQEVEEAGKSGDPEQLLETYEAQQDPAVALAKQKETWKHVFKERWKNEDMAEMISSMGTLDPKTGQPNWDMAMKMASSFDKEYQDDRTEMRENRKTKAGALSGLRKMAEEAASAMEPAAIQTYLSAKALYEENYAPLPDSKQVYDVSEFDLATELKSLNAAGKVSRAIRNENGFVEIETEADLEALQDEADRTGISIDCVYNGVAGKMHPRGGNF